MIPSFSDGVRRIMIDARSISLTMGSNLSIDEKG